MTEKRDPINEWTSSVMTHIGHGIILLLLLAFVCGLIAPIFCPIIKHELRKAFVMEPNCETLATQKMVGISIILWIWAIISWGIVIIANLHPPMI